MKTLLLSPQQMASRSAAGAMAQATARAFRMGPQIHPNRAAYDFYPTPPEATEALLRAEKFEGSIWEPACGQGHISKVLKNAGHDVYSTDLVNHGFGVAGKDFLKYDRCCARNIVTNPPYGRGLADAFAKHAIDLTAKTGGKVAMLMNLAGLCHPLRHDFYVSQPPKIIYALDECRCWPNGKPQSMDTSIAKQRYCWIVWDHGYRGLTQFGWLSTR